MKSKQKTEVAERGNIIAMWFSYGILTSLIVYLLFPENLVQGYLAAIIIPSVFTFVGLADYIAGFLLRGEIRKLKEAK
jgi:hypothetical protein